MISRLAYSFSRTGQFFDNSTVAWRTVIGLLLVHSGLLMYSAYAHSPTLNEPAHLVAGLSHWKFGRFELYRVNPPLVRMVAALPVMAVGYEEDWSGFYEAPGARPVFGMGEDFVAANGEWTFFLTMIARWACMPFSWLGAIVCYLWGRDLYGRQAGLVACFIWCFEPNILAHASLYTADAHATALGLAACYTFWCWLKKPSWMQAALTGVVLGLAELAKTTLILFYPLWPLMWLAYRWQDKASMTARAWGREAAMLGLRMAIGLNVVNLGYGFEGSFQPLGEYHFVSNLFAGKADENPQSNNQLSINRFVGTPLERLPIPFPKNYLLGIDIQQKDFENYGRPFYLAGEWSDEGWWYYYLYAGAIKVPLGLLLLGSIGCFFPIVTCLGQGTLNGSKTPARETLILLTPVVVVVCIVSSKTGINEHFRYVLPVFPYLFIWVGGLGVKHLSLGQVEAKTHPKKTHPKIVDTDLQVGTTSHGTVCHTARSRFSDAAWVLLAWFAASSVWVYPHSLSYFNESIGGPLNGADHLLGSNLDWGQDLRYAAAGFCEGEPPLPAAYFGGFAPDACDQSFIEFDWHSLRRVTDASGGRFLASTQLLRGYPFNSEWVRIPEPYYGELFSAYQKSRPFKVYGYTLSVYDIGMVKRSRPSLNEALQLTANGTREVYSDSAKSTWVSCSTLGLPTLRNYLSDDYRLRVTECCHAFLYYGLGETDLKQLPSGADALLAITDESMAIRVFGASPFVRTRDGVRYRLQRDDGLDGIAESHRDQCLSILGTRGVPLTTPLVVGGERLHVRSLLAESVARFSIKQAELEWTAIALAAYLPPIKRWSDRYGDTYTFDDLVNELLTRPPGRCSCAGTHLLQSLLWVYRADQQHRILSPETRGRLKTTLNATALACANSQHPNGSWPWDWWEPMAPLPPGITEENQRLITTGHLLEVAVQFRQEWAIPHKTQVLAADWIVDQFKHNNASRNRDLVCPVTHAALAASRVLTLHDQQ